MPAGPGVLQHLAARRLATAGIDNGGRLEALVISQNERPGNRAQQGDVAGDWIIPHLAGTQSKRSATGAVAHLRSKSGSQYREVPGGGSFLS